MKFVFSSSATVYGEPQHLSVDEQHLTRHRVTNPYAAPSTLSKIYCAIFAFLTRFVYDEKSVLSLEMFKYSVILLGNTEMEPHLLEVF